ncbi:MAG TPA: hypothetical protein VF177_21535 [Anaerolineae bacterium]
MRASYAPTRHLHTQFGFRSSSQAQQLYAQSGRRSWSDRVKAMLKGRTRRLLDLATVLATTTVLDSQYAGLQTVPVSQIRGTSSKGRSQDFDADFNLLNRRNEARWLNVAAAWQQGKLPPVSLIQVGSVYFVQDGHHRISVIQAAGQEEIEAEVTILRVAGSLPWEQPASVAA